jgi:serine/threonine-protein kinase
MTVGTVNYAAPEQLMGERIDGRADQYALAATAYLLAGRPLFDNSNAAVVISRTSTRHRPQFPACGPTSARWTAYFNAHSQKIPPTDFPRAPSSRWSSKQHAN